MSDLKGSTFLRVTLKCIYRVGRVAQVVDCLPSKCEALSTALPKKINNQSKMNWRHGSSGRPRALQDEALSSNPSITKKIFLNVYKGSNLANRITIKETNLLSFNRVVIQKVDKQTGVVVHTYTSSTLRQKRSVWAT
jgi:hypothetical protein